MSGLSLLSPFKLIFWKRLRHKRGLLSSSRTQAGGRLFCESASLLVMRVMRVDRASHASRASFASLVNFDQMKVVIMDLRKS
jgi:hypothetical protein